jgi:hypothetical protein
MSHTNFGHGVHFLGRFAYREAADRIALALERRNNFCRFYAQDLYKQNLAQLGRKSGSYPYLGSVVSNLIAAALEPAMRHVDRAPGIIVLTG